MLLFSHFHRLTFDPVLTAVGPVRSILGKVVHNKPTEITTATVFTLILACFFITLASPSIGWSQTSDGFAGYRNASVSAWDEPFESEGMSWRYLFRQGDVDITEHTRTAFDSHSGNRSEKLTIQFKQKGTMVLGHYVDYPLATGDVSPSIWIRSDRSNIALGALVVFPKTIRPDTGTPLTLLVPGSVYSQPGAWEKLTFSQSFRRPLQHVVQSVRSEQKIPVSTEGAYIRQIILLIQGSEGNCSLWTDDLIIGEHMSASLDSLAQSERNALFNPANLLSFQLAISDVSLFPDTDYSTSYYLGKEPFGLDQATLERNRITAEQNNPYQKTINRLFDDVFQKNAQTAMTQSMEEGIIGQTAYQMEDDLFRRQGSIAMAGYSMRQNMENDRANPEIISGSGTLANSQDAAKYASSTVGSKQGIPIQFRGSFLSVGETPSYGIRAIEYQNEPLTFLKGLGFNAIWLQKSPSPEILKEARDADIWIIARPPVGAETVASQATSNPVTTDQNVLPYFNRQRVSNDYDSVLAWDMGSGFRSDNKDNITQLRASTTLIRSLDSKRRPIVCSIESGLGEYTFRNDFDVMLVRRRPFLTSLDLINYGHWLKQYPMLATPDFPFWNEIQTQPDSRQLAQSRFFGAVEEMPGLISYEQMRQQVRLSMAAGCHGLLFSSDSPLNGCDHETQYRASALELLNLELMLTDPWFAGGSSEEMIVSNESDISAIVKKTQRTGLVLPISTAANNQYVMGQAAANDISFIAPVREGYTADFLVPGALRKVPSKRKAGGVSLQLEEAGMNSLIFLTQSDWYNQVMADNAPKFGPRMSELAIRLTKMKLDLYEQTLSHIESLRENDRIPISGSKPLLEISEQQTSLSQTRTAIAQAEKYFEEKDYSQAYLQAERAGREIRMSEKKFWETATRNEINRPVLPVSISFCMLPAYLETYKRINSGEIRLTGNNLIIGGNMEDTASWNAGNWLRNEEKTAGITSRVVRDLGSAHSGNFGLRINNSPEADRGPTVMELPPVTITVPFHVRTGDLVCIQGWLKIPNNITHSVDGLTIYENHGGDMLALRFTQATDWRQFAFYRYAAFDDDMTVTFALSGYGEVWLDDISAHIVR